LSARTEASTEDMQYIVTVLDTGSSRVVTGDERLFTDMDINAKVALTTVSKDGKKPMTDGQGTINASLGDDERVLQLEKCHYMKGLRFTLMSISQLEEAGIEVLFFDKKIVCRWRNSAGEYQPEIQKVGYEIASLVKRGNIYITTMDVRPGKAKRHVEMPMANLS
jgi:hypothetical protein